MRSSFHSALALLLAGTVHAQVPLAPGTYTQNFDSVSAGLPAGWGVYTSSAVNTFGTPGTFTNAATAWNTATAGTDFRNVSSDNIAVDASTSDQSTNANRALGWRPVGDIAAEVAPGRTGSVMVTFANTTGLGVSALSLRLFTANDVGTTNQNYQFEYRLGDSGNFTAIGTAYVTGTPFSAATLTADSGILAALSNRSAKVYVRVRGTATSGSPGLDTLGIDDFTITTVALPTIVTPPAAQTATAGDSVAFSVVATGTGALSYQWRRSGFALTGNPSATSATLALNAITSLDHGTYDVVVTDANGSITSAGATLSVNKAAGTVTLSNSSLPYSGSAQQPTATTVPAGRNVTFTFDGNTTAPVNPGSYTVVATIDDPNYAGSTTGTFRIEKVAASIVLGSLLQTFNGTPRAVTATTVPAGLVVDITYAGSTTPPTSAGSYAVLATINHAYYQGAASGTLNILGASDDATSRQPQTLTMLFRSAGIPAGTSVRLSPSSSSSLPITLQLVSGSGSLNGDVLTGNGGNVVVRATQAGDATYAPATLERTYSFVAGGVAPFLTLSPVDQSVLAGNSVTFAGAAIGSPAPVYQWLKDGVAIAGATAARLTLPAVALADAGRYQLDATNAMGTASAAATLVVRAPPAILSSPTDQSVPGGQPAVFRVTAAGLPLPTFQWRRNGIAVAGATAATLTLASPRNSDEGRYDVVVTNELGTVTSAAATLQVDMPDVTGTYFGRFAGGAGEFALYAREDGTAAFVAHVPGLRTGMAALDVAVDFSGQFSARVATLAAATDTGLSPLSGFAAPPRAGSPQVATLQGSLNEASGALTGTVAELGLVLEGARAARTGPALAQAGFYRAALAGSADGRGYIVVAPDGQAFLFTASGAVLDSASGRLNEQGRLRLTTTTQAVIELGFADGIVSGTARLPNGAAGVIAGSTLELGRTERLVNLAVRSVVSRNAPLITGFVITGGAPKRVLIRAAGPALSGQPFRVANTLANPSIQLFRGGTTVAQNDNWETPAANGTAVTEASAQAGAFPFRARSADAALVQTLEPGAYTVQVSGGNGVALAEIYEVLAADERAGTKRLVNLSARGAVGPNAALIAGFVISGNAPQRVLIRGIGPALDGAPFNVADALPNPQLTVYSGRRSIKANEAWFRDPDAALIRSVGEEVGAFALGPQSLDAAILIFLEPGAYTAQVSAAARSTDSTGTALVEVYEVP